MAFNLVNGINRPCKKANVSLFYINTSSNRPPKVIKQLPTSIRKRLTISREEIFNASKYEYEITLKNSGYQQPN